MLTIHLPSGPFLFDSNDPVTVREWKKMFENLSGSRVILVAGR